MGINYMHGICIYVLLWYNYVYAEVGNSLGHSMFVLYYTITHDVTESGSVETWNTTALNIILAQDTSIPDHRVCCEWCW